jgi:hypothetical protein
MIPNRRNMDININNTLPLTFGYLKMKIKNNKNGIRRAFFRSSTSINVKEINSRSNIMFVKIFPSL